MRVNRLYLLYVAGLLFLTVACTPRLQGPSGAPPPSPPVRVLIGEVTHKDSLTFSGACYLYTPEARYAFGNNNNRLTVTVDSSGFRLYNSKRFFRFLPGDQVRIEPTAGARFHFHNKAYGGTLMLRHTSKELRLVEHLPVEEYLRGVVPAEIFTTRAEWFEAVKAQAVVARTYVAARMKRKADKVFDVYGDVRDQAYGGVGNHTALADQAVRDTRGSVLMYENKLIEAYYHACDGGISEDPGEVWGNAAPPYLSVRQDVLADSFACGGATVFRWHQTLTVAQLDSAFADRFGFSLRDSTVKDTTCIPISLNVARRSASGRVTRLNLKYGTYQKTLKGNEIRRFLAWPPGGYLPSTLFRLESDDNRIHIIGGGNGHGVGMCQYGAMARSRAGMRFYHILQSYYPGTRLEKIW